jgi:hypothetical protein
MATQNPLSIARELGVRQSATTRKGPILARTAPSSSHPSRSREGRHRKENWVAHFPQNLLDTAPCNGCGTEGDAGTDAASLDSSSRNLVANKGAGPRSLCLLGPFLCLAVTAVFGKTGYALSWAARADRLGITPEELCDRFKTDPNRVKKLWAELTVEKERAADAK